nr:hypothetical protein M8286_08535 [Streptococcus suis]
MARPPAEGMGTLFIRRALGLSTAPTLRDIKRTKGVAMADMTMVVIMTIMYFRAKGIILSEPS